MPNALKAVQVGTDPLASDVRQLQMLFNALMDAGALQLSTPQATPAAPTGASSGTAGNLNGAYIWKTVLITGWKQDDGSYYVSGFVSSGPSASATVTNNSANVTGIAIGTGPVIGRAIYRTAAGGAAGTEKFAGVIWDNTTTTWTDNIADTNLGKNMTSSSSLPAAYGTAIPSAVPTTNSTGTAFSSLPLQQASQASTQLGILSLVNNQLYIGTGTTAVLVNPDPGTTQKSVNSGVISQGNIGASVTAWINFFRASDAPIVANVNGTLITVQNGSNPPAGDSTHPQYVYIPLDAPPSSNVTPSLPGSGRDDLVFLEAWRDAATGAWQWRIRVVDGVDFSVLPEGLGWYGANSLYTCYAYAQGGNSSLPFAGPEVQTTTGNNIQNYGFYDPSHRSSYRTSAHPEDIGLYVAGDGSSTAQSNLKTADGYVYAVPLFRVRRRNSAAYDPDTNPLGGAQYGAYTDVSPASTRTPGQSSTLVFNTTSITWQVGQSIYVTNNSSYKATITGISVGSTQTTVTIMPITSFGSGGNWANISDRPDGLYSNIIDASDIIDLRHQVSLTGFDKKALLELGMNKLLRGQLNTKDTARYTRDYIGLNYGADDTNTLLYLNFNGSMAGTANGTAVSNQKISTGTEGYVNGVQGLAASFGSNGGYGESYTLTNGVNFAQPGEIEFVVKNNFVMGTDNAWRQYFLINDSGGGTLLGMYTQPNSTKLHLAVLNSLSTDMTIPSGYVPNSGDWYYGRVWWDGSKMSVEINGSLLMNQATYVAPGTLGTKVFVASSNSGSYFNGAFDWFRISNIVRSGTPLPTGFSYANGDRILDGPNGDFNFWSDDVGGTTGVNGRTNPYGLSRVPNQVAARVAYNGSEIRHYYGQGITAGWITDGTVGNNPTGSFESGGEYQYVNTTESADGTRTTFTANLPSNAQGIVAIHTNSYTQVVKVGSSFVTPSSISVDSSGKYTVALSSAPASGTAVQVLYVTAQRHAHFVPATKGFEVHDWTDDTFTGDGTKTIFVTTKAEVTSINHVRLNGVIQTSGYTASPSGRGKVLAGAAQNATTLNVDNVPNGWVPNGVIWITDGYGNKIQNTLSSVTGSAGNYTITLGSPLSSAIPQNAVVLFPGNVSFTTAPASGESVDIVYESILTPGLGDNLRVCYQHTPYQGLLGSAFAGSGTYRFEYVDENGGFITTLGSGSNSTPNVPGWMKDYPVPSAMLPIGGNDYSLKRDTITLAGLTLTNGSAQYVQNEQVYETNNTSANMYSPATSSTPTTPVTRGYSNTYTNDGTTRAVLVGLRDLTSSVPHLAGIALLAQDTTTGELLLYVMTMLRTDSANTLKIDGTSGAAIDVFKLPGRPLIKAYGGVSA